MPRIGILGLGKAGCALAGELRAAGWGPALLWNRGPRTLPQELEGLPVGFGPLEQAPLAELDAVLLAVRDDAVAELAAALPFAPGTVVLHLSGARDSGELDPLRPDLAFGGYHPLQAFRPGASPALPVPPYRVALDGDAAARALGRRIAEATGHPPVELPPGAKAAYHCAAVLASNCLVALEATAERVMRSAGVPEGEAWGLLWPLVVGTLANLPEGRFPAAITGPVARGDAGTVRRNRGALGGDGAADAVYRILGEEALALARTAGLPEDRSEAVAAALAEPPPPPEP